MKTGNLRSENGRTISKGGHKKACVATLNVKITLNLKKITLRVNDPPLM